MKQIALMLTAAAVFGAEPLAGELNVTLRGSPASMARQNAVARNLDLTFARTPAEIQLLLAEGKLVPLVGNVHYEVADFVSWPVALPAMRTFIERLAVQYHAATGERLVVTSLMRPASEQPGNSHALSVHPTGLAVDLRVSQRAESREWLEATLLGMERQGLLDVTREYSPPHYHIALFPAPYMEYVALRVAEEKLALNEQRARDALSSGSSLLSTYGSDTGVAASSPRAVSESSLGSSRMLAGLPAALLLALLGGVFRNRRREGSGGRAL